MINLKAQYNSIKAKVNKDIINVIKSTQFILGQEVEKFEEDFAKYIGTKYAVSVASGTDALHLTLVAYNISKDDEVIIPTFTFAATAFAIAYTGAKPVFVDITEGSFNINATKIEEKITNRTKAIMPVHLYGQSADMDEINRIAKKYKLLVIEDACQSHGALYKDKKVGTLGNAACYSFYPSKSLGAYGDGGAIVTNDAGIATKLKMLRNQGQERRYFHTMIGFNSRLDSIQATILRTKLRHLDKWNKARRKLAETYNKLLKGLPIGLPEEMDYAYHTYYLYTIKLQKRDILRAMLKNAGVDSAVHYDMPLHLQECFKYLGYKKGNFPVAEKLSGDVLSIPMYPELSIKQIELITDIIKKFCKENL